MELKFVGGSTRVLREITKNFVISKIKADVPDSEVEAVIQKQMEYEMQNTPASGIRKSEGMITNGKLNFTLVITIIN